MAGSSRSINQLKRERGLRPLLKQIILVCEGMETEPNYYKSVRQKLKLRTLDVLIIKGISDPKKLLEIAIREKSGLTYPDIDEVWCVFDKEQAGTNPHFDESINIARKHGINLAVSNPSIEFWFLLHYEYTNCPFQNANQVIARLQGHLPKYCKNMDVFTEIWKQTEFAHSNVIKVRKSCVDDWSTYPNPSTRVNESIISILELKQESKKYQ